LHVGREDRCPLQKRRGGRKATARLGAGRCSLELHRHTLVGSRRRLRPMPRPAIRVEQRVSCFGDRAVGLPSLGWRRRLVHGRSNEWVAEGAPFADLEEAGRFGRIGGLGTQTEHRRSTEEQEWIP
jgi:hypothetical protein